MKCCPVQQLSLYYNFLATNLLNIGLKITIMVIPIYCDSLIKIYSFLLSWLTKFYYTFSKFNDIRIAHTSE